MVRYFFNLVKWLILLLLVLGLAFLVYATVKITKPLKSSATEKVFTVDSGSTTKKVAKDLESEGLISRWQFFVLYVNFKKAGEKIQAGNYSLSPDMSIVEIASKLSQGDVVLDAAKFTVIEGWTMAEIAEALESADLASQRDFLKLTASSLVSEFEFLQEVPKAYNSLEGYLFPDTYLLAQGASATDIARKMLANFDRKLTREHRQKIQDQGKNVREIVILASIIEREVGRNVKKGTKLDSKELEKLFSERRLVASVFYNRLKIGKALESDATISYITGREGSAQATLEETKIDSPYNTYRYAGLPPGPISNPSLDSIMAAIEPASSDYLFFLTAPDGTAYFAETLEEHIANRAKYLD